MIERAGIGIGTESGNAIGRESAAVIEGAVGLEGGNRMECRQIMGMAEDMAVDITKEGERTGSTGGGIT